MKKRLNAETAEALRKQDTRYICWCTTEIGLGLEVMPTGRKSWYYRYSRFGRGDKVQIGTYPTMAFDAAKKKIRGLKKALSEGEDPKYALGKAPGQETTMAMLAVHFEGAFVPLCKATTQRKWKGDIRRHILPRIGTLLVHRVAVSDIQRIKEEMAAIPAAADTTRSILKSMFDFAILHGLRPKGSNPCDEVKPYGQRMRQVYLTDEEYEIAAAHLDTMTNYSVVERNALKLLLLTGARKAEIQDLLWEWVESDQIRIPWEYHKTGRVQGEKILILDPWAQAILASTPKTEGRVFPNRSGGRNWQIDTLWREARAGCGLERIRIHDIRHSYASIQRNADDPVPIEDIQHTMNHASISTTRRYAHINPQNKRRLALSASALVAEAMRPKKKSE